MLDASDITIAKFKDNMPGPDWDTHREKAPSNKTPALTKSTNMDIWVVGTSNQLFVRGS